MGIKSRLDIDLIRIDNENINKLTPKHYEPVYAQNPTTSTNLKDEMLV